MAASPPPEECKTVCASVEAAVEKKRQRTFLWRFDRLSDSVFQICTVFEAGTYRACSATSFLAPTELSAITAQLEPAAEIHESRPCGKPLFMVGWNGKARRCTYHVPSSN
jgi:hypothetical protein